MRMGLRGCGVYLDVAVWRSQYEAELWAIWVVTSVICMGCLYEYLSGLEIVLIYSFGQQDRSFVIVAHLSEIINVLLHSIRLQLQVPPVYAACCRWHVYLFDEL